MLVEKVACAAVSPHQYLLSYTHMQCYQPLRQMHSYIGDFNDGVCCTTAERYTDTEHNRHFASAPAVLARGDKMPKLTMSGNKLPKLTMLDNKLPKLTMSDNKLPKLTMSGNKMPKLTMSGYCPN